MKKPALFTDSKKTELPILIIDKKGTVGKELADKLSKESLIILLSDKETKLENVIHIPFLKKVPQIPDNTYYAQILIDEQMEFSKDLMKAFIKKAQKDNSVLVLVININFADQELISTYLSLYDKLKIVITGDIFIENGIYESSFLINKFIESAKTTRNINIPGDGTLLSEPVFLEDAVYGILQIALIENEQEKVFFLFPKFKPTLLSIAHIFQKINPDIKIDFVNTAKNKNENKELKIDGKYILDEDYNLYNAIRKINLNTQETEGVGYIKNQEKEGGNKINNIFIGIIATIFFFFLIPVFFTILFSGIGTYFINNFKNEIQKENLLSAKTQAFYSKNSFLLSKLSFEVLFKEAEFINQEEALLELSENINEGLEVSSVSYALLENLDKLKAISSKNPVNKKTEFLKITDDIKNTLVLYQKQKQSGNIPKTIEDKLNGVVNFTSSTIDFWPDLLGFNGKKTYLVLIQNNMRLRPGGGLIDSYGVLTVENGSVLNHEVYDATSADEKLKGRIEPPFAIRRYAPSVNWYLKDSSFSPDFSKNALAATVFLNSKERPAFDGVIGIDLYFVKNLLKATGPVKISSYNKEITAENLFETTLAENKNGFLESLFKEIAAEMSADKKLSKLNILQSFTDSILQKHITFALNKSDIQSVFAINGWGAALSDNRIKSDTAINDYLGIFEASLGENNANYYISKNVSQTVSIEKDGSIKEVVKIDYKNSAKKSGGNKNMYKNYIKFVLPQGAILEGVQINEEKIQVADAITDPAVYETKGFKPPSGLEVEKTNESGKTVYGFLVIVDEDSVKSVKINYSLSGKLNIIRPDFSYSLKLVKQPGVEKIPYEFSLTLPEGLTVLNMPEDVKLNNGIINVSEEISKDIEILLFLTKN